MKKAVGFLWLSLFVAGSLIADTSDTKQRTVTQLGSGIYEIRHEDAPDGFPQGNTTVIIGDRDVLVVDSCYYPPTARQDIAQIRQWTSKPVRFLVNTHWHYDHTMGNGVYAEAFPGIEVIAQTQTRKNIKGYNPGWFARYPGRTVTLQQQLDSGKKTDGTAMTEKEKSEFADAVRGRAPVLAEFSKLVDRTPDMGFDTALDIDLGSREVQIRHLGRGNTAGDAIVYLPKEKILAAGDLLDHPIPYLGGGYPVDEIATLEKLAQYDIETIVPGHGDLLHDKVFLGQVIALIKDVTGRVEKEIYRVGNGPKHFDEVQKAVLASLDVDTLAQQFAGSDKGERDFFTGFSLNGLITAAYAQLWGK